MGNKEEINKKVKEQERRLSELKQSSLCIAQEMIDEQKQKIAHINTYYSGDQRDYELSNFRREFTRKFISISPLKMLISDQDLFEIVRKELMTLYDTK